MLACRLITVRDSVSFFNVDRGLTAAYPITGWLITDGSALPVA